MDLQLRGKRAIVTGGSRGIGKAIARELIVEGASVILAARDEDALARAVAELQDVGAPVSAITVLTFS
jgi:NAD(P)-dependent dehydrogenase (short-subunit alcohol dehydrogenase family)